MSNMDPWVHGSAAGAAARAADSIFLDFSHRSAGGRCDIVASLSCVTHQSNGWGPKLECMYMKGHFC